MTIASHELQDDEMMRAQDNHKQGSKNIFQLRASQKIFIAMNLPIWGQKVKIVNKNDNFQKLKSEAEKYWIKIIVIASSAVLCDCL
jgi:hypothetical protein